MSDYFKDFSDQEGASLPANIEYHSFRIFSETLSLGNPPNFLVTSFRQQPRCPPRCLSVRAWRLCAETGASAALRHSLILPLIHSPSPLALNDFDNLSCMSSEGHLRLHNSATSSLRPSFPPLALAGLLPVP